MNQGDALGLRRQHVVIVLRRDQLQKLPGAGHSQLRVAKDDERADVQIIRDLADGKFPVQARHINRIGMHNIASLKKCHPGKKALNPRHTIFYYTV